MFCDDKNVLREGRRTTKIKRTKTYPTTIVSVRRIFAGVATDPREYFDMKMPHRKKLIDMKITQITGYLIKAFLFTHPLPPIFPSDRERQLAGPAILTAAEANTSAGLFFEGHTAF